MACVKSRGSTIIRNGVTLFFSLKAKWSTMSRLLPLHVEQFQRDGFVVIENILTQDEVEKARDGLHKQLFTYGIDHDKIISGEEQPNSDVRIKGKVANMFYSQFKIDLLLIPAVYEIFKELMQYMSTPSEPLHYSDVLPYVDRVNWRLPDHLREDGGLGLHIDRNPWNLNAMKKFRPIQGFVTLTDQYGSESGGLRVVPGFHHQFYDYFARSYSQVEADQGGEFYRLHDKKHTKLQNSLQSVDAPAGALVLWNNMLPHATCNKLTSFDTREVVYVNYIPNTELNRKYHQQQAENFKLNVAPPSYITSQEKLDRNYDIAELSDWQRQLLGV